MDEQTAQQQRLDELRRRAEEHLQQAKSALDDRSYEDIQTLLHELDVHQIELTLQNEELRQTQVELGASRDRYADLYDFAPVGYLTVATTGMIVEVNLTCTAMFGRERRDLFKLSLAHLIVKGDEDVYYLHSRKIFDTKMPQFCELRMRRKNSGQNSPPGKGEGWVHFYAHLECAPVVDDNECVTHIRIAITDITARKQMEEQLRTALQEKEVLLKEVYHRVKNNFQAVSSLLYLQAQNTDDPRIREALGTSRDRIKSMELIHERLYQTENLAEIDFGMVAYNLAADLFHSYGAAGSGIALRIDAKQVLLTAETAIPCALLLNELVSNALKYAFPEERHGEIRIELHERDEDLAIVVSDSGVGFPAGVDFRNSPSLGLHLVNLLARQLKGTLELERSPGTTFTLTFPKGKSNARSAETQV